MGNKIYTLEEASVLLKNRGVDHTYIKNKMIYVPKNVGLSCENNSYNVYFEDNGRVLTAYSGFNEDRAVREVLKRCKIKCVNSKKSRG